MTLNDMPSPILPEPISTDAPQPGWSAWLRFSALWLVLGGLAYPARPPDHRRKHTACDDRVKPYETLFHFRKTDTKSAAPGSGWRPHGFSNKAIDST